ncbi:3908_t:CDS:10 [Cetraspora pellucida]|uniref:3908_t:CDS:1 n=1 Tax=Cetraspora pellucida TaxID=1433469 RepID=A0A9N9BU69_9GLOM|nr:3908_t:CDS:10 [Cetraspora pellucida]
MDQAVYEVLSRVLSPDPNIRMSAELRLKELCNVPVINLKNYVVSHWSSTSETFVGIETTEEAYVISKIAHNDWPDYWPDLLDLLISLLKTGSPEQVHGAMRVMTEEHPEATESFLMAPVIPDWLQIFISILKQHTTDNEEREFEEYGLKLECLNLIIKYFPKLLSSYLIALLEPIWLDLVHQRERYPNSHLIDSDGEVFGFEYLLFAQFEFVGLSVRKKSAKPLFVQSNGESTFLKQVVWIILSYMQMTKEQVEIWLADANQFVADDDDETFNFTVRVAAGDLLEILLEKFPEKTLQALAETTQHLIEESNIARAAGDNVWWKVQEACLKAVGFVSNELATVLQDDAPKVKFDLPGLFEHVVFGHLTATEYPFLQGRAFVFASQYATLLPGELASRYVSEAVCAIQGVGAIPVKVSALRALQNFCRHLDAQYVAPFQSNIIENVASLLNIVSEDSLILVLETLEEAIKINNEVTARYENHTIYPIVTDIFEELSSNVNAHSSFQARALPPLANILINNTDSAVTASAIDLIASLVKGGPSPLPSPYIEHVFPPLIHLMLTTEDRSILQNGEICLKYFVQKDCARIAEWTDVSGKTGLDYVIQFIAKSLQPTESESATFFGDLVVKLIEKAGNRLLPVLPELLRAVAVKLESARTATFIQSLLMIFAHLTLSQKSTVINFMDESDINGRNGLDILLNTWLENHDSFQGHYNIKISAIALSELFLSCDPRIQNIKVKGDLIIMPSSTTIKIIKLLLSDLQNAAEGDNLKRSELDDVLDDEEAVETDDDDDEWEDVEEPSPFAPSEDYIVLSEFNKIRELEDFEDDPDIKDNQIYHTNLREYLVDFFRHCASHNINNFAETCSALNEEEQLKLRFVITGSRT